MADGCIVQRFTVSALAVEDPKLSSSICTYRGLVDESPDKEYNSRYIFGPIAQLGARLNGIEKAEGSNPSGST